MHGRYSRPWRVTQCRADKSCGTLVTVAQFTFISLEGIRHQVEARDGSLGWKKSSVPIASYGVMVILFWVSSILNNIVFHYDISLPLHSVFRSSSMIMNVILAFIVFKRMYDASTCGSAGCRSLVLRRKRNRLHMHSVSLCCLSAAPD